MPAASASASSRYSAVTKLSPAFLATCSALSNSRAVSWATDRPGRSRPAPWAASRARASTPSRTCCVAAAGGRDQARGQAFLIVEEDLQQMFGGELLVAFAQRQALGRLNEAARPLGEFLDIHTALPVGPVLGTGIKIRPRQSAVPGRYGNSGPGGCKAPVLGDKRSEDVLQGSAGSRERWSSESRTLPPLRPLPRPCRLRSGRRTGRCRHAAAAAAAPGRLLVWPLLLAAACGLGCCCACWAATGPAGPAAPP